MEGQCPPRHPVPLACIWQRQWTGSRPIPALTECLPYPHPPTHPLPARDLARALADFALCPEFSSLVGSLDPPVSAESGPEYYEEPPGAGDGGEKQISWTPEVEFLGPASEICWAFFVWLVGFVSKSPGDKEYGNFNFERAATKRDKTSLKSLGVCSPGVEAPVTNTGRSFRWGRDDPTARDPRAIGSLRGAGTGPSLDCGGNKRQVTGSPASPAPRGRSRRDSDALQPPRTPGTRQDSGTRPPLPRSPERVLAPHRPRSPPTTSSKFRGSAPRSLPPPRRRPQPAPPPPANAHLTHRRARRQSSREV